MLEDGGDDVGIVDACDEVRLTAAFGASFDIYGKDRAGHVTTEFLELVAPLGFAAGWGRERAARLFSKQGSCEALKRYSCAGTARRVCALRPAWGQMAMR